MVTSLIGATLRTSGGEEGVVVAVAWSDRHGAFFAVISLPDGKLAQVSIVHTVVVG